MCKWWALGYSGRLFIFIFYGGKVREEFNGDQSVMEDLSAQARANLEALTRNPYPGRGVVAGLDHTGTHVVMVTWIMGRSKISRNRRYVEDSGRIYTDLVEPDPTADTSLIIYNAMDEGDGFFVASNGDQTDTAVLGLRAGRTFVGSLSKRDYEPDPPNFTPRISVVCDLRSKPEIIFSRIRKSPDSDVALRDHMIRPQRAWQPGIGWCITTYEGDGNPLPSFLGDPYPVPLTGGILVAASRLWGSLNEANRVGLAIKFISLQTGLSEVRLVNKYPPDLSPVTH